MRTVRRAAGPTSAQPYYTSGEMDRMCREALIETDLMPTTPRPVRIDRFVEKRFRCVPEYAELPAGVLGFTEFSRDGVVRIVIAQALDDDPSSVAKRRERSTLAHEAGHGLFHAHLFVLEEHPSLLPKGGATPSIMCREEPATGEPHAGANESRATAGARRRTPTSWHEYQANQAIGGLLLPKALVRSLAAPYMESDGAFGVAQLPASARRTLIDELMGTLDVNRPVAAIRVDELFPPASTAQLSF